MINHLLNFAAFKKILNMSAFEKVRIGHVNLRVADLQQSLRFYKDVLGFKITKQIGDDAVFLSYGGYHHDLCINSWESKNGLQPAKGSTGLYHVAILFADQFDLVKLSHRFEMEGVVIKAFVDHVVNVSIYLDDPDGNGIELYWDRPQSEWWDENGTLKMAHHPITLEQFLALWK